MPHAEPLQYLSLAFFGLGVITETKVSDILQVTGPPPPPHIHFVPAAVSQSSLEVNLNTTEEMDAWRREVRGSSHAAGKCVAQI